MSNDVLCVIYHVTMLSVIDTLMTAEKTVFVWKQSKKKHFAGSFHFHVIPVFIVTLLKDE